MNEEKITLNKFITNNEKLELLEAKLNKFNPFSVLKIGTHEVRHSNVLAWLLDPNENHKLGDKILKKFVTQIILNNDLVDKFDIAKIANGNFFDAEIFRELNNIDILIVSEFNKLVILIENKVYSKESKDQLKRYIALVRKDYPDYNILPVFLTLNGDEPSQDEWAVTSYEEVYPILRFVLELEKDNLNKGVYDFINHYLKTLEVILMKDEKIIKLCKEIYQEHKEAINLINEYCSDSNFEPAIELFLDRNKNLKEINRRTNSFWFLPKEIIEFLPNNIMAGWLSQYPVSYWFAMIPKDNRFAIIFEIGPIKDSDKRMKFVKFLDEKGFKIPPSAFKPEARYTRVITKYVNFEEWENTEKLTELMEDLMNNKLKDFNNKILPVIKEFKWN